LWDISGNIDGTSYGFKRSVAMKKEMRESGIDVIGDVPWGTHFSLFYKTRDDLSDVLVSFFTPGLRNNEFCMCVTADPMNVDDMKRLMRAAMPDFDDYVNRGQIEIIPYTEWYLIDGVFDHRRVMSGWKEKLRQAQAKGFAGARVTGDTFWLDKPIWKNFIEYEQTIDGAIEGQNFLVLCSYSLDQCGANEIINVVNAHQFALVKHDGDWSIIENEELKETRKALDESEKRYCSLFENMLNGFAYCEMLFDDQDHPVDFVYLAVNDAFRRLTGLDNVVGKRATDAIPGFGELQPELFKIYGKVALTGRPEQFEVEFKPLSLWLSIAVYSTEKGYFTAVFDNITERKRAEEKLKAAKQQAELYLDLMGHDINNMHQIALGYLELARDMQAGEGQAMLLDKPVEVLQRSAQLIQNVKKLQKLHDGVFKTGLVDLCKELSDVRREFGSFPNKPVTLNFNGYEHCFVQANDLLRDVFANLVSNAIKHTGDQSDIVVDLDVVTDNGSRYCRVMVEDDGPGIPDGFKTTIFNRTLKGTNTSKGMGLGLYLVKSLVDSYGGMVRVEDRVFGDHTKGSRFVVILPAVEKKYKPVNVARVKFLYQEEYFGF
jgi:signal transduction histidine kinase